MFVPEYNGVQSLVFLRQEFSAESANGPWLRQVTFVCVNLFIGGGGPKEVYENGDLGRLYRVWG